VSVCAEVQNSLVENSNPNPNPNLDLSSSIDGINWNITMDETQIDWDVGAVEEQSEESGNMLTAHVISDSNVEGDQSSDKIEGINWNVGIENLTVEMESQAQDATIEEHVYELVETGTSGLEERSQLLETDYRNNVLDDLFEVLLFDFDWNFHLLLK
jgi:CDK5 regulatory subunit-associated protein 3